ncbi:MAG: hypothetical protein HN348_31960 [Proteobacteria bacterium]|nr:hypothetical protein [Pseudomonadota bacterium]
MLYHLDPRQELAKAEDQAGILTERFVTRARGRVSDEPWPEDTEMPLSPRWRRSIESSLTPLAEALFVQHYGNNRSLEHLERLLQVDRTALEAARGGLREALRRSAHMDGLPVEAWPVERLDRLLRRLAAYAPGPCPPVLDVIEGAHREHVSKCPRCDRTLRLVQSGIIAAEDLLPPTLDARPTKKAQVLVLHFHPSGRSARANLARELETPSILLGDDLLLVDWSEAEAVAPRLVMAAELGLPTREHLRGMVVSGPGAWSVHGLLGPLVERALGEVRSQRWGEIDGLEVLPLPLPNPPSARRMWGVVGVLILVGSALMPLSMPRNNTVLPVAVTFTEGRGGIWTDFDVPEEAVVTVVREEGGKLDAVLRSTGPADKAALTVGDGSYRVHTVGPAVLVAATFAPVGSLDVLIAKSNLAVAPLEELANRIKALDEDADVELYRRNP